MRLDVLFGSSCDLGLNRFKGCKVDNGFVGVGGVVLRKLASVDSRYLGEVVLAELGLQEQIARVGIAEKSRTRVR